MGSGIAQVSAQAGFQVILTDTQPTQLTKTKHTLETALTKWTDHQKKTHHVPDLTLPKVTFTSDLMEALVDTDVVIEAIVENLSMKHTVFKTLDTHAPPHTLLVTNTSSIPIQAITQVVSKARLPWVAGMHFFNPVPRMALVELIATPTTDPLMMEILTSFCKHLGKVPVICKDTPGFIVNRLLVPYMMEAIKLAERGDASIQDIDTAMKLGAGYPMGPFELADFVGLDTLQFIVRGWYENGGEELKGNPMVKPSSSLDQLIRHGKLGRKSGAGFYDYSKKANM
ncbi:hypothetical protein HMI56_000614 [Coelomomyces lativittatus]|nr:hypothetical protein HMI56_000614 [Coelomomyces lativittatus]